MIVEDFNLSRIIFELKYNDAFLYLDNCGAAIMEVRKNYPDWEVLEASVKSAVLKDMHRKMQLAFNHKSIRFTQDEVSSLNQFKKVSTLITPIFLEKFQIENFNRVGNRFLYHLPLKNVDEGQKIIEESGLIEIPQKKLSLFGEEFNKSSYTIYLNKGKEFQYRIDLSIIQRIEPEEIMKKSEKFHPKCGLRIDVDAAIIKEVSAVDFSCDEFIQSNYKFLENNLIKFI